jgi:hypothetical protein
LPADSPVVSRVSSPAHLPAEIPTVTAAPRAEKIIDDPVVSGFSLMGSMFSNTLKGLAVNKAADISVQQQNATKNEPVNNRENDAAAVAAIEEAKKLAAAEAEKLRQAEEEARKPKISVEQAVYRIQSRARIYIAKMKVGAKRVVIKLRHRKLMLLLHWASVNIQRIARGMLGRARFIAFQVAKQVRIYIYIYFKRPY